MVNSEFEKYGVFARISQTLAAKGLLFNGFTPRQVYHGETADVTIDGVGWKVDVHFSDTATPQQRARVATIIASADKRERRAKPESALLADIDALSPVGEKRLLRQLLIEKLRFDPGFARRAGVALDGDETEGLSKRNE